MYPLGTVSVPIEILDYGLVPIGARVSLFVDRSSTMFLTFLDQILDF